MGPLLEIKIDLIFSSSLWSSVHGSVNKTVSWLLSTCGSNITLQILFPYVQVKFPRKIPVGQFNCHCSSTDIRGGTLNGLVDFRWDSNEHKVVSCGISKNRHFPLYGVCERGQQACSSMLLGVRIPAPISFQQRSTTGHTVSSRMLFLTLSFKSKSGVFFSLF